MTVVKASAKQPRTGKIFGGPLISRGYRPWSREHKQSAMVVGACGRESVHFPFQQEADQKRSSAQLQSSKACLKRPPQAKPHSLEFLEPSETAPLAGSQAFNPSNPPIPAYRRAGIAGLYALMSGCLPGGKDPNSGPLTCTASILAHRLISPALFLSFEKKI